MKVDFVNLRAQDVPIREKLDAAIKRIMDTASYVLGEDVAAFEAEFASYVGAAYAVGVDSGLSALKLSLVAHGIGAGDEAIVPAHTFVATAAAATFAGATPVFVDVAPGTYNLDPAKLERALTPRTKVIIPVHLYGIPADMDPILAFASEHDLLVVEDAAQAHGAYYKGRRIGSLGHTAAFSFYPAKNLGAAGDAGMVTTNDAAIAERIKALRNCGQLQKNIHELAPYNHRLDTLQAAILRVRLTQLDAWNEARRQVAGWYSELLAGSDVILPGVAEGVVPVWHVYVIRVPDRDGLRAYLAQQGIGTGIHYPSPVHLQPYYENLGYQPGSMELAEAYTAHMISLPMHPNLTRSEVEYVAEHVLAFVKNQIVPEASH
jgi:dTDP-4-amino-4,6-dideoxygalactose transaminase